MGVRGFLAQPGTASASARRGATSFARKHEAASSCRSTPGAGRAARRVSVAVTHAASPDGDGNAGQVGLSRGAWAGRLVGAAVTGAVAVAQGPRIALAELGVGEGGLPDGARQFSDFVKVQKDWAALGVSLKDKGANVSPEEWKNVSLFLRKVYQLGGELEFLAGTFPSDKKKTALALVKSIQKEVQAADGPAREKDTETFMMAQVSVQKKFEDFMEYFNDVPSEL
eukprot:g16520.t1